MKTDTICCYCISKQVHDKRGIKESLHVQITRARLTVCEEVYLVTVVAQLV